MRPNRRERAALRLLVAGPISADDGRADPFSDDGDPDTWNRLFAAGLAEHRLSLFSDDCYSLRITPAGRAALEEQKGTSKCE